MKMHAEKQVASMQEGRQAYSYMPVEEITEGEVIRYSIQLSNSGGGIATNVVVNDKIPENTVYIQGSAMGKGSKVSLSVDGGVTFHAEENLRQTLPTMCTNIRWEVENLHPGVQRQLGFKVQVTSGSRTMLGYLLRVYGWLYSLFRSK